MDQLRLTLVQTALHWEDRPANLRHFSRLLEGVSGTDLVLLPEMFTTGFSMRPEDLFDRPEGETLRWLREKAASLDAALCGSVIIGEEGKYYNRLYFVEPGGSYYTYSKKHLFTLAGEHKIYAPGEEHLIVDYRDWRIMPLICYDLRFPVWCRNTFEADLQIFVANWPARRSAAWKKLLPARAIENMCYVAGLNRVGEDGNGVDHSGDSAVYDELGEALLELTPGEEALQQVVLDKAKMLQSRQRFSFLQDRDHFALR